MKNYQDEALIEYYTHAALQGLAAHPDAFNRTATETATFAVDLAKAAVNAVLAKPEPEEPKRQAAPQRLNPIPTDIAVLMMVYVGRSIPPDSTSDGGKPFSEALRDLKERGLVNESGTVTQAGIDAVNDVFDGVRK